MFQDIIICWDYGIIKVNEHDNNNIKQISSNNSQRNILQEGACYNGIDMLLGIELIEIRQFKQDRELNTICGHVTTDSLRLHGMNTFLK
jgi:hypothetical protein